MVHLTNVLLLALPFLSAPAAAKPTGSITDLITLPLLPITAPGTLDWKIRWNHGKKYVGVATDENTLSNPTQEKIVRMEYGSVTPENSMKWESTEPNNGNWTLDGADFLVDWARKNHKSVRGHTLVWHSQLPQWVWDITDADELKSIMIRHIHKVAGRYKGKMHAWDVVNEVFNEDGTFRPSPFYDLLGKDFIKIAFREAHKADPYAKLFINDYNLDFAGPKVDAMVALVKEMREEGVPVHGIGSQAHLILNDPGIPTIKNQLAKMAAVVPEVALTEIDIRVPLPANKKTYEDQKRDMETVFNACLEVKNCVGVTTWGVSDKYSWVPDVFPGEGDALLWDENFEKKPAYYGASKALDRKKKN